MNLSKLAEISEGQLFGEVTSIDSFSIDSRTLKQNDLYIALEGKNYDGAQFIPEAINKGAVGIISNNQIEQDIPNIVVASTYEFMERVAKYNRSKFSGKVIGITGTNGKTSTKQILSNLLNDGKSCHKTLGNKNNQIGVPYTLLSLKNVHDFSVIEMGTSESGEIAILNNQVKPDIAAITNVSIGHLDGLRDTESIAREKGNILNFYNDNGVAVLPKDSVFFDFWSKKTNAKEIITFGFQENSDFKVSDIEIDIINNFTNFYLRFDGKKEKFFINGASRHSPLNAALSVAAAIYCGCPLSNIKKRLKFIDLPERRLAISNSLRGSLLIDDSYNSNPASLKNAVDSLEGLKRKKVCILGDMKELGSDSQKIHQEMYEYISERVDQIFCIGDEWSTCSPNEKQDLSIFENQDDLYSHLISIIDKKTILLVKGSRSTRMDLLADKLKE